MGSICTSRAGVFHDSRDIVKRMKDGLPDGIQTAPVCLDDNPWIGWVNRMKDYRDCFVHYTPVDTMLSIRMVLRKAGW